MYMINVGPTRHLDSPFMSSECHLSSSTSFFKWPSLPAIFTDEVTEKDGNDNADDIAVFTAFIYDVVASVKTSLAWDRTLCLSYR